MNVGSAEFSKKQAKTIFIDTTGLDNFARNFDDVYETAYIDMNNNYYKQLTEVVDQFSSYKAHSIRFNLYFS
jgi:hypothetical protein